MGWYNVPYDALDNYIVCGSWNIGKRKRKASSTYKLLFGRECPSYDVRRQCICGQNLVELCFVCPQNSISLLNAIVVGNECINKFSISKGKCCEICGARHFNRTFNLCNEHIKIKKRVSGRYTRLINDYSSEVKQIRDIICRTSTTITV